MPPQSNNIEELMEEYSQIFESRLKRKPKVLWKDIIQFGKRNSEGRLWVYGSFVYRSIIEEVYGIDKKKNFVDIDLVADNLTSIPYVPRGWAHRRTFFSTPYIIKRGHKASLDSLKNYRQLVERNLSPTIENLLRVAPFNVQSIAWEFTGNEEKIHEGKIMGEEGVLAIYNREIRLNNKKEAQLEARIKNLFLDEFMKQKANELGLTPKPNY